MLNLAEYVNGLVYFLAKNLANGTEHPYDAAQVGISGLTVFSDTESTSDYGDIFWLTTGENVGRPKTIKESLETIQAKLIQQQVNISLFERVDLTALSAAVNSTNELVYKVKNNVLGTEYSAASADLSYPISEYIYRLYLTLFPDSDVASELSTNNVNFPLLTFSTEVSQTDIPGCGLYVNLQDELSDIKEVINGAACDPSFEVTLDQQVFSSQPTNIKEYIEELANKAESLSTETFTNAQDIVTIEGQIGNLQGAVTATQTVAGISEEATTSEILLGMGMNFSGNNNLFMNPRGFCDSILTTSKAAFFAPANGLGGAFKKATEYSLQELNIPTSATTNVEIFKESFSTYLSLDANTSTSYVGAFGRHYTIDSQNTNVSVTITNLDLARSGEIFRIKNSGATGTVTIYGGSHAGNGYTIDGNASITLNAKDCMTIMYTGNSNHIIVNKYIA